MLTFVLLASFGCCIQDCLSAMLSPTPEVLRTPEARFSNISKLGYSWPPNYIQIHIQGKPTLRMHYLDIGSMSSPETILLLHGTPAWSFLYRKMIPFLLDEGYRVIAPDFIGFGRSDKLSNPADYTHQLHLTSLLQLVEILNLDGVTLFAQDLGGPTGLSVVRRERNRFRRIICFNTWLPQGDIFSSLPFTLRHLPYLAWRATTRLLGQSVPVGWIFSVASDAPVKGVLGYKAPYPSVRYKAGPSQWPLLVPLTGNEPMAIEMQRVKEFLRTRWTGPVLYGYSDRELFTTPGGDLFRELFQKNGCEVKVLDSGHFLQEDQAENVTSLIVNFINRGCHIPK